MNEGKYFANVTSEVHCNLLTYIQTKCLFILSRHMHSFSLAFSSTDLTSTVLQRSHQLKDWLLLHPVHLLPELRINSCQRTPPSDSQAPAHTAVLACIFTWPARSHGHPGAFHRYRLFSRWCEQLPASDYLRRSPSRHVKIVGVSGHSAENLPSDVKSQSPIRVFTFLIWWAAKKSTVA